MNAMLKTLIDRCKKMLFPKSAPQSETPKPEPPKVHRMAPRKADPPPAPSPADPERRLAALARQCRDLGFKAGLDNPSLEPDPLIESSLRESATAMALTLSLSPEELQIKDQHLRDQRAKLDQELNVRRSDQETAAANVRILREELAVLGNNPYPTVGPVLRWSTVGGIALSLAPTIHDFFPGLFQMLRWLIAFGFSFGFGLVIVNAILPEDQPQDLSTQKENTL